MTESGERDRAREAAVEDYLNSSASAFDSYGQGFDKGWQAAFEAGRGQALEQAAKAVDAHRDDVDTSNWRFAIKTCYVAIRALLPAPPDSGDKKGTPNEL